MNCLFQYSILRLGDFLWEGGALEKKLYLVSWSIVCTDKSKRKGEGGELELSLSFESALLGKCCWIYYSNEDFFGSKLSRGSMGRKEWVGSLVKLRVVVGLVFGKVSRRGGISSSIESLLKWVMTEG